MSDYSNSSYASDFSDEEYHPPGVREAAQLAEATARGPFWHELEEARSEIARHHELIAKMRQLLFEAQWRLAHGTAADEDLSFDIARLLSREVG